MQIPKKKKKDKHRNEEFDTEINFVFPHVHMQVITGLSD